MTNLTDTLLNPLLRADPMGPRITYYDDASGERVELSTVTLANWAAKTGNLLRDELGAGPGSRIAVLLPTHWQTVAVFLGIWWIGAEVVLPPSNASDEIAADIALCTADLLDRADDMVGAGTGGQGEVAVLSLDAFGAPVPDLPIGVTDYATAVRVHGDQMFPEANPGLALAGLSATAVLAAAQKAADAQDLSAKDRVLSTASWRTAEEIIENLLSVFIIGASIVQVVNPNSDALDRRRLTEKVTRDLKY